MFISMHSILGWTSFCMNYCINASWHGGDQPVALLRCNEAQVALIAAFRSSALLGLVSLIISSLTVKTSHWTSSNRFCVSPLFLQILGPWFSNEMQNLLSSEKRTLDHWATAQLFFSLAQLLLTMFLVQKWLGSSFPEDVWAWWLLMHSLQLQFTPREALPSVWTGFALILKLTVIPVACAHFPTQFLHSSQLCI